jgi:hypothetical protein
MHRLHAARPDDHPALKYGPEVAASLGDPRVSWGLSMLRVGSFLAFLPVANLLIGPCIAAVGVLMASSLAGGRRSWWVAATWALLPLAGVTAFVAAGAGTGDGGGRVLVGAAVLGVLPMVPLIATTYWLPSGRRRALLGRWRPAVARVVAASAAAFCAVIVPLNADLTSADDFAGYLGFIHMLFAFLAAAQASDFAIEPLTRTTRAVPPFATPAAPGSSD